MKPLRKNDHTGIITEIDLSQTSDACEPNYFSLIDIYVLLNILENTNISGLISFFRTSRTYYSFGQNLPYILTVQEFTNLANKLIAFTHFHSVPITQSNRYLSILSKLKSETQIIESINLKINKCKKKIDSIDRDKRKNQASCTDSSSTQSVLDRVNTPIPYPLPLFTNIGIFTSSISSPCKNIEKSRAKAKLKKYSNAIERLKKDSCLARNSL